VTATLSPASIGDQVSTRPTNLLIGLASALLYTAIGMSTPALPRWTTAEVSASSSALGSLAIAYTIGAIGCRPLMAKIGPYLSQRQLAIIGTGITALGFGLHLFATNMALLWIARLIVAVGETFAYLGMTNLIASAAGPRAAEAMSYNSAALFAGLGLGPLLGDPLSRDGQWALAFGLPTALCILGGAAVWALGSHAIEPPRALPGGSKLGLHRSSIRPGLVLGALIVAQSTWQNFLTPYSDSLGIDNVGLRLAAFAFSVLILRVVLAKVPQRVGLRTTAAFSVSMISLALLSLGVIGGSVGMWVSTVGMVVGMAQMFPSLIGLTLERETNPAKHAVALSTFTMFFEIGAAASGTSGFLIDQTSYETAFVCAGILSALGIPMLLFRAGTWGAKPALQAAS
jgi:predicted MFS family arabinose efflux permease